MPLDLSFRERSLETLSVIAEHLGSLTTNQGSVAAIQSLFLFIGDLMSKLSKFLSGARDGKSAKVEGGCKLCKWLDNGCGSAVLKRFRGKREYNKFIKEQAYCQDYIVRDGFKSSAEMNGAVIDRSQAWMRRQ